MSKNIDTVQLLLDAFENVTFKNGPFKSFYNGDPGVIPNFNLPALIVEQTGDDTSEAEMGEDDVEDRITVMVVFDRRDDYNGALNTKDTTKSKIRKLISSRDPETNQYDEHTVKHAIRSLLLDNDLEAVGNSMTVEYGLNPRPVIDGDSAELTSEGHVTFAIQYSVDTY